MNLIWNLQRGECGKRRIQSSKWIFDAVLNHVKLNQLDIFYIWAQFHKALNINFGAGSTNNITPDPNIGVPNTHIGEHSTNTNYLFKKN